MAARKRTGLAATSRGSLLKSPSRAPKASPNDTRHLTERQMDLLIERFMGGWSGKALIGRFAVNCLRADVSCSLKVGWRTRSLYSGDCFFISGLRPTKRNGIAFQFKFNSAVKTPPDWAVNDGCDVVEMDYDKAVDTFGAEFSEFVFKCLGGEGWSSLVASFAEATPEPETASVPSAPPAPAAITMLPDWGTW